MLGMYLYALACSDDKVGRHKLCNGAQHKNSQLMFAWACIA